MKKITTLIALVTLSVTAFASNDLFNEKENKFESLKIKVASAKSSDWNTPFEAAQICLNNQKNMSDAYVWVEQSIKAKATPQNLELKGDYLALHGLNQMAFENYKKALELKIALGSEDFKALQQKIQTLKKKFFQLNS
ncbi:hypothetical protein [Sediminitomix flava]|uniref:Tetratricopeptide repeat protein n=1 Tax=Sediminitomix flava TaxID=379075 RepID=A0A315Z5Z9_SEDFL|nr:hypothetical protein [Sediminitomix flava]PWJ38006.1 hypothetical protein BC781_108141 [Sediminitomix flava]